jgi:hypothetical protein
MPLLTSDWPSIQLGRDVFLHSSAPVEWWNEYAAMAARGYDPGIMMAKTSHCETGAVPPLGAAYALECVVDGKPRRRT